MTVKYNDWTKSWAQQDLSIIHDYASASGSSTIEWSNANVNDDDHNFETAGILGY